eukprot:8973537-Alexandrium_andersonii.AAC.1
MGDPSRAAPAAPPQRPPAALFQDLPLRALHRAQTPPPPHPLGAASRTSWATIGASTRDHPQSSE